MKIKKLIREWMALNEKLIVFNKGKKANQVVIGAGGGGSGKGWALANLMDGGSYKVIDVDQLKELILKLGIKKGDKELANLDLKKPEDVRKLHMIAKEKGYPENKLKALFGNIKSGEAPNLYFDKTLKDMGDFTSTVDRVSSLGYKPEDIHLVWVLANFKVAYDRNLNRPRVIPQDIFLDTHKGASQTMQQVISGSLPSNFNGEIYVILNNDDSTEPYTDKDGNIVYNTQGNKIVKNFTYLKVKDSGKPIKSDKQLQDTLSKWIEDNAPKAE